MCRYKWWTISVTTIHFIYSQFCFCSKMAPIIVTYQKPTPEIPHYNEWKRMQNAISPSSSTATTQMFRSTTSKPTMQVLYSYGLDPPDNLITFICKHLRDSEWTRLFCYVAILLTIVCGIIYTVRSIYTLRLAIERQRNDGRNANRTDPKVMPGDEQELSRLFPTRQDPIDDEISPYAVFNGDQSGRGPKRGKPLGGSLPTDK